MRNEIRTTNDLMAALTEVLNTGDYEMLEECHRTIGGWIVDSHTECVLSGLVEAVDNILSRVDVAELDSQYNEELAAQGSK